MTKRQIVLIAHNVRSSHNVGSLLRTAEGLGVVCVYLTGYTPYPQTEKDSRLPHIARKVHDRIQKTALGAETTQPFRQNPDIDEVISSLKEQGYLICGLEQSPQSLPLNSFVAPDKVALVIGNEVNGLDKDALSICDKILEIPMFGQKESFNVVQAAAMALYHLTFYSSQA